MEKLYLAQAENSIKLAKANYYPNVYMDTEYRVKKDEDENDDWVVRITSYNVCYTKLLRDQGIFPIR